MNNDAVLRLREPGAWVLLGSAALYFLGGLVELLFNSNVPFTFRAFNLVNGDQFFAGVAVVGLVIVSALLATRWGGGPTPQARNIVLIGAVLLAAIAVLDALSTLAGLAAGGGSDGVLINVNFASKVAMFLYGVAKLAVVAVALYYVYSIFQSFGPVHAGTGPFPQAGYQQQPPYGGYQQQQQQYGPPPQAQYGQQPPPGGAPGAPYAPPPQQPGYYRQQSHAQPYQQAQPSESEWSVAYGEQEGTKGDNGAPNDPYRPPQ